jgi:hypothetical protein
VTTEERIIRQVRHRQDVLQGRLDAVRDDIRGVSVRAFVLFALSGGLAGVFAALVTLMIWEAIR